MLHEVGGKRTVVSHFNKATKGRLVRALLESGATPKTPAALADADHATSAGRSSSATAASTASQLDVVVEEL